MAELPWFCLSPNPISLIQYAILSWLVSRQLLKISTYQTLKYPRILSLVDGFFAAAFFIVLGDSFWAGFCALKWVPLFPQDLNQILFSFLRDVAACFLFFFIMPIRVMNSGWKVKTGILIMFVPQGLWFLLAPSPAFTDYTFAWRHGFSANIIIGDLILSHFLMRLPLWFTIISSVDLYDCSTEFKKGKQHIHEALEVDE